MRGLRRGGEPYGHQPVMATNNSGAGRSTSTKVRALQCLTKVKEASKEIFRNLQTVSKSGRDEPGGAEKAETLRNQRENYIKLLCSFQSELHETVGELKQLMEGKSKMGGMRTKIEKHEDALRKFGTGLKNAEQILSDALRRSSHEGRLSASGEPVELDVDDLIRYSRVISYTTSAQDGWEPNTPLTGALPPAPQSEMMARSRLFDLQPSGPPSAQAAATRRDVHDAYSRADADLGTALADAQAPGVGKRSREAAEQSDEDEMLKIWSYPLLPVEESALGAGDTHGDAVQPPQKRQAWVQAQAAYMGDSPVKDKAAQERQVRDSTVDASVSENAAANLRPYIELPKMPSWWRPGMPVLVSTQDKS